MSMLSTGTDFTIERAPLGAPVLAWVKTGGVQLRVAASISYDVA